MWIPDGEMDRSEYQFKCWRESNAQYFKDKCSSFLSANIKGTTLHSDLMENIAYLIKNDEMDLRHEELRDYHAACFLDYFHQHQKDINDIYGAYVSDIKEAWM